MNRTLPLWTSLFLSAVLALTGLSLAAQTRPRPVDRFVTFPFSTELVSAASGQRIAWILEDHGVRNVWGASGPAWEPKQLTTSTEDTF